MRNADVRQTCLHSAKVQAPFSSLTRIYYCRTEAHLSFFEGVQHIFVVLYNVLKKEKYTLPGFVRERKPRFGPRFRGASVSHYVIQARTLTHPAKHQCGSHARYWETSFVQQWILNFHQHKLGRRHMYETRRHLHYWGQCAHRVDYCALIF